MQYIIMIDDKFKMKQTRKIGQILKSVKIIYLWDLWRDNYFKYSINFYVNTHVSGKLNLKNKLNDLILIHFVRDDIEWIFCVLISNDHLPS